MISLQYLLIYVYANNSILTLFDLLFLGFKQKVWKSDRRWKILFWPIFSPLFLFHSQLTFYLNRKRCTTSHIGNVLHFCILHFVFLRIARINNHKIIVNKAGWCYKVRILPNKKKNYHTKQYIIVVFTTNSHRTHFFQ